jgi:O-antigen/teichoic acid export membrane protein
LSTANADLAINGRLRRAGVQSLNAFLSRPIVFGTLLPAISILNALVGMALPMLVTPLIFGQYALAATLFQYGLIFDCGMGPLVDRWIPAALARGQFQEAEKLGQRLLWVRLYIGFIVFAAVAAGLVVAATTHKLPFGLGIGLLSALAGILYMISLGPCFIYRVRSARRNFAYATGVLGLGLALARPAGLVAGGLAGCFLALVVWYAAFAGLFHWRMPARFINRPSPRAAMALVLQGLPFFATSFVWAFYLTANRWFASGLMESDAFGRFAFGANVFSLLVGAIGNLSAFYYPRIVGRIASESRFALSWRIAFDCAKLTVAVGGTVAIGILVTPTLLAWIYPQYIDSVDTVRILLVAVPAMVLVAWLMPISLSSGRRPWLDGLLIYPAATAILYFAIRLLARRYGDEGVAASSIVSALPLIAMLLFQLRHAHVVKASAAITLIGIAAAVTAGLSGLTWFVA